MLGVRALGKGKGGQPATLHKLLGLGRGRYMSIGIVRPLGFAHNMTPPPHPPVLDGTVLDLNGFVLPPDWCCMHPLHVLYARRRGRLTHLAHSGGCSTYARIVCVVRMHRPQRVFT